MLIANAGNGAGYQIILAVWQWFVPNIMYIISIDTSNFDNNLGWS